MSEALILEYTVNAMMLVIMISMPPIIVAAGTGILVSLMQALTQIQEQTLSFAIKLIAVAITMLLTARWMGGEIFAFTLALLERFPTMVP